MKKKPDPYKLDKEENDFELTKADFRKARPITELMPDLPEKMRKLSNRLGRPPLECPKIHTSLRLDADVLAWLKEGGPGFHTRTNNFLRAAMELSKRV